MYLNVLKCIEMCRNVLKNVQNYLKEIEMYEHV